MAARREARSSRTPGDDGGHLCRVHRYKESQAAALPPDRRDKLDLRARLERTPPSAALLAELAELRDDAEMREAALFAVCAFSGSEWSGEVVFRVCADPEEVTEAAVEAAEPTGAAEAAETAPETAPRLATLVFTLSPGGVSLAVGEAKAAPTPQCSVRCTRQVMLDVFGGALEITAAIMGGQLRSDNHGAMMAFKRAFRLDMAARASFREWVAAHPTAVQPPEPEAEAACGGGQGGQGGTERPPDPGLERLRDDPELYVAASYLHVAFDMSEMEVGLAQTPLADLP